MFKKRELISFAKDRLALGLLVAALVVLIAIGIATAFSVRLSDVQIPVRYSDYGFTNLYRDKWYALTYFLVFGIISFATSGYLAIKLHDVRHKLSLSLMGMCLVILIITLVISIAVFRLAAFSL